MTDTKNIITEALLQGHPDWDIHQWHEYIIRNHTGTLADQRQDYNKVYSFVSQRLIEEFKKKNLTIHEISFEDKHVSYVNLRKNCIIDVEGEHVPEIVLMPSDWRQQPEDWSMDDLTFEYRYCSQYETMFFRCLDNDVNRIDGIVQKSEVHQKFFTYNEDYEIIEICFLYNGFHTALAKLTDLDDKHYKIQGFSYPEPYNGTYYSKIRYKDGTCTISFRPIRPNPYGSYGSYFTHNLPLFTDKDEAKRYSEWIRQLLI